MAAPKYVMMPSSYKAIMSVLVVVIIGGFGVFNLDNGAVGYVLFALAALMILGVWIFPDNDEIKVLPKEGETDADADAGAADHRKEMGV